MPVIKYNAKSHHMSAEGAMNKVKCVSWRQQTEHIRLSIHEDFHISFISFLPCFVLGDNVFN
jgi:hypothetical protein